MESHLIYTASSHMRSAVNWSEWVYCGVGDDLKADLIQTTINEYFKEPTVYFVSNRKESAEISKENAVERIRKDLAENELFLWGTNFKKAIHFDKIGVMKTGSIST